MIYSVTTDEGKHYGVESDSPENAKAKAISKGKNVTGVFANANDGNNTPTGNDLSASSNKEVHWAMPKFADASERGASSISKAVLGAYDIAGLPIRAATAGYKSIAQGIGSKLGLGSPDPTTQDVLNSMAGNDPDENIISREVQNPINYIPGIGEERAVQFLGRYAPKVISKVAPKISVLIADASKGALQGATTGTANSLVNSASNNRIESSVPTSIISGAIARPIIGKIGNSVSHFGEKRMAEAIKVNPSTQVNSANPPDLENIIAYHNPISGKTENLAPYNGDNKKLSESVSTKIDELHEAQKPLVKRMSENSASSTNMDDAFQQTMDYAKDMHKKGLYDNDMLERAENKLASIHNTMKTQNLIRNSTPEQESSIYSLLKSGQPLDENISNASTSIVPFDIAYNTRKRIDKAIKWSNAQNPNSHPVDEDILHQLRTNINGNLNPNMETATSQSLKDYEDFQKLQRAYSELLPWDRPLKQAAARSGNNRLLSLSNILPVLSGVAVHEATGGSTMAGVGTAALLTGVSEASRSPGIGSMLYDAGKAVVKKPSALTRGISSLMSSSNVSKYAPAQFGFKKQENK